MNTFFKRTFTLAALVFALCLAFAVCTTALADGDCGNCTWTLIDGTLTIAPKDGTDGVLSNATSGNDWPWYDYHSSVTNVVIKPGVKANTYCGGLLGDCSNLKSADLTNLDTSGTTYLGRTFEGCSSLESVNISTFDTSKVTYFWYMFANCSSLTSVDLSSFDTSEATNTQNMFEGCSKLKTITVDPDKWTMAKVDTSWGMFWGCTSLVGGAGTKFDSKQVKADYAHVDGGKENPGYLTSNVTPPTPVPTTGDNNTPLLFAGLLLLAGAGLIALKKRSAR